MLFPLTDEQQKIVDDRGGELLVSAAAGSGKTRVLVERLLDRVTKEEVDIDRFLVITFTKAAAAELRGRIAQELSDRLAQNPNDGHLRRQTTLIYRAQISTIHSFCAALLRESGHLLDLDPDFRLCDEGEGQVLMQQVLEDVLDRRYEDLTEDSPFALLADTLSAGRDDSRLAQITVDIFAQVQSYPDPARWLKDLGKGAAGGCQAAGPVLPGPPASGPGAVPGGRAAGGELRPLHLRRSGGAGRLPAGGLLGQGLCPAAGLLPGGGTEEKARPGPQPLPGGGGRSGGGADEGNPPRVQKGAG